MKPIAQDIRAAIAHYQSGRLSQAEAMYRDVLRREPRQPDALHLLGVVEARRGAFEDAIAHVRKAIRERPDAGGYYNTLGNILKDAGRFDEARVAYGRAITLEPESPLAYANRALLHMARREFADAATDLRLGLGLLRRTAPATSPESLRMWSTLTVALAEQGSLVDAEAECRALLQAAPRLSAGHANLGAILTKTGRLAEAEAACREAVALDPKSASGWNGLGIVLEKLSRLPEALEAYEKATQLNSHDVGTRLNAVRALGSLGQFDNALETAIQIERSASNHTGAKLALADLLREAGRLDESLTIFDQAVALNPSGAMAHSGRIFARHFHAGSDAAALAADQHLWNQRHGVPLTTSALPHLASGPGDRDPNRQIRIGYVSPDFTKHVLALLMLPLFEHHDRQQFAPYFYSDVVREQPVTERFKRCAAKWTPTVGLSDERVADLIRQDRIDILIDLTMHMQDNRLLLFARKPAPIQVTWCYPGSTGLTAIDYRITDPQLDPPGIDERIYSEKTVRLPDTFFCYDPLTDEPAVGPLPMLATGHVTFGCLNNFCKTNAGVFDAWARVLAAVPKSRMLILSPPGRHRTGVEEAFARHGVTRDRIEHVGRMSRPTYLALYNRIDIALDTFPYNGHTTSLDGFWMGVPVVTLIGDTVVGRAGLSELSNLGLTELAATNVDEFVHIAAGFANDSDRLASLRADLRPRMERSPLMNGERFARNFEAACRTMWQDYCRNSSIQ